MRVKFPKTVSEAQRNPINDNYQYSCYTFSPEDGKNNGSKCVQSQGAVPVVRGSFLKGLESFRNDLLLTGEKQGH